ncbi:hypothetical protein F5972_08525 [Microbispora cellulosiformans]|uniref:Uncharacterized protein n=1 Tax=Microbispora cellulosiformans TaxID=2614688 RepID=A0A5J5K5X1_9ACTN|nr:hypothetical protein [Microbispora cellulosiformans]KAA9379687.1 hypothetical protein F5972_08525 [Microbispora cellulosiformans]
MNADSITAPAAALPTIPVGVRRDAEALQPVRTAEQRAAILAIAARDGFAFATGNPCSELMAQLRPDYVGPFSFVYYTTDGQIHGARIGIRGTILREVHGPAAHRMNG